MRSDGWTVPTVVAGLLAVSGGGAGIARPIAAATIRYDEVKNWPQRPAAIEMGEAAGVAVDATGHVLVFHRPGNPHGILFLPGSTDTIVADRENARLQLFDQGGVFKREWTGAKNARATGRVFSVAADREGNLYVGVRRADYDTAQTGVVKLDRNWSIEASIGFGRFGDPVFNAVHDLAVGPDGSIDVAETRTKRVVRLRPVTSG
jgi:hypothetical protein